MMRSTPLILAVGLACLAGGCATSPSVMAVNVAVTDLRAHPHTAATSRTHDPSQETQLLYGERVKVLKLEDGWAQVEAVEQSEFSHTRRWQGYPGWVPASVLIPADPLREPNMVVTDKWAPTWRDAYIRTPSTWRFPLGTRLRAIDMGEQVWRVELLDGSVVWMPYQAGRDLVLQQALAPLEKRRAIITSAEMLLGDTYFWGGRSPAWSRRASDAASGDPVTGVDCSGLVNLAYRTVGIDIPRDAHEQYLRAAPIQALQPGDLIFLSERGNPARIVHVMLYAGAGEVIEGPGTGTTVRRITIAQRFGRSQDWLAPGAVVDEQTVYFGSYLP